ncbi:hypothetical protein [Sphingobium sp.]|uniref:hypothetical protein n=1 Tax=Sphingobium sp. TaxID=1912891 RepID=UPI0035C67A3A
MTHRNNSVPSAAIVSDERIRDVLRREYDRAVNVARTTTRAKLAEDSGLNIYQIDAIVSRDAAKQRRITAADALSFCWALGDHAVGAFMATIGYAVRPLDGEEELQPTVLAANALAHLSVIATAAADGRIDHTELPACRDAADQLIATILPISSHGDAA